MAIAFDAATEIAAGATASPTTGNHTPSGTPRGVIVEISHEAASDIITGVTYGGVAMTRTLRQEDNLGEFGTVYQYVLGSGIPTGTQTVTVSRTNSTTPIQVVVKTFTASADTEIVDTVGANGSGAPTGTGNVANPSVDLSYGGRTCIASGIIWDGVNAPTNLVVGSGLTEDANHDFGASSVAEAHQTTPGSTDFTFGYTVATNSYAMIASAISEVATSTTRLYTNNDADDSLNLAISQTWTSTVGTVERKQLNTDRAGTNRSNIGGSLPTSSGDYFFRQYVSPALDTAQTIAGNISMVFLCSEATDTADAFLAYIVRVIAPDGQLRGTLAAQQTSVGPTEFGTTAATRIASEAVTSIDAEAGDRIVVELGVHGVTPAAGAGNVFIETGVDAQSDYALTEGLTGLGVGWVEFDSIITFAAADDVFGFANMTGTLSASASGTATNTPPVTGSTGTGDLTTSLSASASGTATQTFTGSGAPSTTLSASISGSGTNTPAASGDATGTGDLTTSLSASASGTATNTPDSVTGTGALARRLSASIDGTATNPNSPVVSRARGGGRRIRFEIVDDEPEPKKKRRRRKKRPVPAIEAAPPELEPAEALPELPAAFQIDPALLAGLVVPQAPMLPPAGVQAPNPLLQGSPEDRLMAHFLQQLGAHQMPAVNFNDAPYLVARFLQMGHQ